MIVSVGNLLSARLVPHRAVASCRPANTLFGFALIAALALAGCTSGPAYRAAPFNAKLNSKDATIAQCARLIASVDDAVERARIRDGAAYQLPGFPYWRTDRVLAAARGLVSDQQLRRWLRAQDREARMFELENLPLPQRQALVQEHTQIASDELLEEKVDRCADMLADSEAAIPAKIAVPDDYDTWKRVLGFYAIARVPFASGVRGYQRDTEQVFATPVEKLSTLGTRKRVLLAVETGAEQVNIDPRVRQLFVRHAPVLDIDVVTPNDEIGAVTFAPQARVAIDTSKPTAYVRGSHAIVNGKVLTQLIYSFWFPSRPKTGTFDLLGGHLDGITWRVTLAPNGDALVYDTIHNCGCYHQFFPTSSLNSKPRPKTLDEWAFVPQRLPRVNESQRVVLRIASGTHYLQRVNIADGVEADEDGYRFMHDDTLRSLPLLEGGRRSLFQPDGIVQGSERGERFLFWPMGVREPGAMRQWGRHATAFVGRRHFDDPLLLDKYFLFDSDAIETHGDGVR